MIDFHQDDKDVNFFYAMPKMTDGHPSHYFHYDGGELFALVRNFPESQWLELQ